MNWEHKNYTSHKNGYMKKIDVVINRLTAILDGTDSKEIISRTEMVLGHAEELKKLMDESDKTYFKR